MIETRVKLPSGYKISEALLQRIIINNEADTLDFMEFKELAPKDLAYIFNVWLEQQLER
jgi:hypothetical protein